MDKLSPYQDDGAYLGKLKEVINFFDDLATEKYNELIVIKKKQMDKTLTQEDANRFNEIIDYYNNNANQLITDFNQASIHLKRHFIPSKP